MNDAPTQKELKKLEAQIRQRPDGADQEALLKDLHSLRDAVSLHRQLGKEILKQKKAAKKAL